MYNLIIKQYEKLQRAGFNSIMQGTASEIIKQALQRIYNRRNETKLTAKILLQIHDEILLEVPTQCLASAVRVLQEEMEQAVTLSVPLKVKICHGMNWFEGKK